MYESHFGITGPPFQLSPDPSFYFDSQGHHQAFESLRRGLVDPSGFIVISGEIGAGKTTLMRTLLEELDSSNLAFAQVLTTQLDDVELLRAILISFGAPSEAGTPAELNEALQRFLAALAKEGRRAVLIIDEAQNLDRSAFHWLVQLEKGSLPGRAPLKVCLVGQPELRTLIESGDLVALRDRVGVSCHLGPLGPTETGAYVRHRLGKVGWTGTPSFEDGAFEEIHRWTQGIPRRINMLCNRLMLSRFLTEQVRIDAVAVAETARDLRAEIGGDSETPPPPVLPVLREAVTPPVAPPVTAPILVAPAEARRTPSAPAVASAVRLAAATPPAAATPLPPTAELAAPEMPRLRPRGESRPLLCVVGGQGDHVKAAALMRALAARSGLPVTLLVRCYANNAFERHRDMYAGLDVTGRLISLGIAGGTYAGRAAELMKRFEFVVDHCLPAAVIVFDGSDAALSCGLVASRKALPVLHVGAGLRGGDQSAAADITRRLADQLADVLYTADAQANEQLAHEGVASERICFAGNLLADALQIALRSTLGVPSPRERLGLPPNFLSDRNGYGVVVLDAAANVNDRQVLSDLVAMLRAVSHDVPLVWTMLTRTREQLGKFRLEGIVASERIACLPAQGYPSFVQLLSNATCVLTDSWNVQEEATALAIPCLTIGVGAERGITSTIGSNTVVGRNKSLATRAVWDCIFNGGKRGRVPDLWDGQAAVRIAEHMEVFLQVQRSKAAATA